MKSVVIDLFKSVRHRLRRSRFLWVIVLASMLLSGCVKYDVGVNFQGEHHGAIVQNIRLGKQLTSLSNDEAQQWLSSLQRRAKQLGGRTQRLSEQEITVRIPFSSGQELTSKFNRFFNPVAKKQDSRSQAVKAEQLPSISSKLSLMQNNFFFVQRNHLSYDLDLRSLSVLSANGNVIVSPGALLDLQFSLETPWGAKGLTQGAETINPKVYYGGHKLVWTPQPGELNHLEAIFWLPSPLGIGTAVIIVLVLAGFYGKYKTFPGMPTQQVATVVN
ncbi:DUF3153 domain-containing protein [Lyngbya aestuarii]|uniref:DUF3153 domain-containing protein n=1 Tax=Lyngbya aestuarii TaxID=118322 RepID=UPI00403DE2C3